VLTPITVSSPTTSDQLLVLSAGLAVMLVANAALLRFSLTPLRRLADQMGTVDVLDPGERLARSGTAEVATVIEAFNAALDRLEAERRSSTRRVLFAQEAERRRIAQELHDSTGQHLTAAALALGNARTLQGGAPIGEPDVSLRAAIDDATGCLREAQREIRVLSYLLHPPHLQSHGLAEALEDFAAGFAMRAGFKIKVKIAPEASTIGDDVAVHLFRVCQEALTNVYRHAHAKKAQVTLEVDGDIRLTVKDDGVGFDASTAERVLSVGLPGMRDRMARLGGAVEIYGDPGGTTLVATLPLDRARAGGARTAA